MEAIEVKLDETNEIYFNVQVEGTSAGSVTVRLVCESDDFSAVFPGHYTPDGEVKVVLPELKKNGSFKENKDYAAQLEVMVENRFFIPLKFGMRFKESVKVFAEVSTKNAPVLESKVPERKPDVVEVKKTAPAVSATIVVKERKEPEAPKTLKESSAQRQSDIFSRLAKTQTKK